MEREKKKKKSPEIEPGFHSRPEGPDSRKGKGALIFQINVKKGEGGDEIDCVSPAINAGKEREKRSSDQGKGPGTMSRRPRGRHVHYGGKGRGEGKRRLSILSLS